MRIEFCGYVEVSRVSGKFATRDEIESLVIAAVEDALGSIDLNGLGPDSNSEYQVDDSSADLVIDTAKRKDRDSAG